MTHTIYIPVWDTNCHILLWPEDPIKDLMAVGLSESQAQELRKETCEAITWTNDESEAIILVNKKVEGPVLWGIIVHELFHAVHSMLQERGVKLRDSDNNESHAYLIGFLSEELSKRL